MFRTGRASLEYPEKYTQDIKGLKKLDLVVNKNDIDFKCGIKHNEGIAFEVNAEDIERVWKLCITTEPVELMNRLLGEEEARALHCACVLIIEDYYKGVNVCSVTNENKGSAAIKEHKEYAEDVIRSFINCIRYFCEIDYSFNDLFRDISCVVSYNYLNAYEYSINNVEIGVGVAGQGIEVSNKHGNLNLGVNIAGQSATLKVPKVFAIICKINDKINEHKADIDNNENQ